MEDVVVVGGAITCSHGGVVILSLGDGRLDVDGSNVVVQGQETGLSFVSGILPCPFVTPDLVPSPCTATQAATAGISAKITIDDKGVLLKAARGNATNAKDPTATWSVVDAGQNKLQSDG